MSRIVCSNAHRCFLQTLMTIPITPPHECKKRLTQPIPKIPIVSTRRTLGCLSISFLTVLLQTPFSAAVDEVLHLERYTDSEEGFTLLVPANWIKVDKAGATVLFQDPNKGSNNVGVVVSPVRIKTLSQFGSPEFVADKLIMAEKRKESTKEAEVVGVLERKVDKGVQVYEFEYKVDSTRGGLKRVFSAAFVASGKLYLLNITHSDGLENPIDSSRRQTLEQILHSFDTAAPSS